MTRISRRIIFYTFLLIFILFVPAVILYAEGYGFDWEKRTFVASGGIYLKSSPPKAEIYINDVLRGTTNRFVKRLIPKTYSVKLVKEEYHTWEKNIIVKSGLVTRTDNIFLVLFNPKILLIATESDEYTNFSEKPYPLDKVTETIQKKSKYTVFKIENINPDKSNKKLYFLSNNNLYSLDWDKNNPDNSILSSVLVPNVLNYVIYKNGIIYLDYFSGKIFELDTTSLKSAEFFDRVFPAFNQGEWIISNDAGKLLCKKENSVEILWLQNIADESVPRIKGEIEKIDLGEKILDVVWLPQTDEHLIISTNDSILIIELDNRPPQNIVNFIATEKPEIKYDPAARILYFLSQERLYQTEL
jgi:hypothetical protein